MQDNERKIAQKLVQAILDRGYSVTVWEGGDFAIKRSRDADAVMQALESTDHDIVRAVNDAGEVVGRVMLIWGNGDDLISDHTDNAVTNDLVKIANGDA